MLWKREGRVGKKEGGLPWGVVHASSSDMDGISSTSASVNWEGALEIIRKPVGSSSSSSLAFPMVFCFDGAGFWF